MPFKFFSVLVVLCLGTGFVSLPLPVQSLPVNTIAQPRSNLSTAEGFLNRGVEKLGQGDVQGAIAHFDQALRINPNYADAYANRGIAYSRLGDYQKAIADSFKAVDILQKRGRIQEAQQILEIIKQLQSRNY